jgi:hypothetical protein
MLRAQVTPFKKCKVTSYQPKPINDAQATALLQDASKLSGQLWWAEVGSVPCRKDGCCKQLFSFRYGSTDILVFQQIFRDHYLRALYSLFPEDAAPKYILDAGANAGYATALFKLLWPDAIVVSLEPDPANFAQMRLNTAGFTGVHRVNAGLWGRQANITVSSGDCKGCEWGRTFRETLPGEKGVPAYSVNVRLGCWVVLNCCLRPAGSPALPKLSAKGAAAAGVVQPGPPPVAALASLPTACGCNTFSPTLVPQHVFPNTCVHAGCGQDVWHPQV